MFKPMSKAAHLIGAADNSLLFSCKLIIETKKSRWNTQWLSCTFCRVYFL